MKDILKRKLTVSDALLILINLVPIWAVWFKGWNAREVFMVYCLETVIIGIFVLLKLWAITLVRKQDDWNSSENNKAPMSGYFFMLFFLVHYGFFVAIQMTIFLEVTGAEEIYGIRNAGDFVVHFRRYLSNHSELLLIGFVISYGLITIKDFFFNGSFRTIPMNMVMFEPYGRIFIQQLTVIVGSFFIELGTGKIFIAVFALAKIFFEVILNFKVVASAIEKKKSVAGSPE